MFKFACVIFLSFNQKGKLKIEVSIRMAMGLINMAGVISQYTKFLSHQMNMA